MAPRSSPTLIWSKGRAPGLQVVYLNQADEEDPIFYLSPEGDDGEVRLTTSLPGTNISGGHIQCRSIEAAKAYAEDLLTAFDRVYEKFWHARPAK